MFVRLNMMENEFFTVGMDIKTKYTNEGLPKIINEPGPFAFNDEEYIREILKSFGFKNIKVDKTYSSISTKDSIEDNATILIGIGPRARILSEHNLSSENMSIIKKEMLELSKKRKINGKTTYRTCLNYVSAVK